MRSHESTINYIYLSAYNYMQSQTSIKRLFVKHAGRCCCWLAVPASSRSGESFSFSTRSPPHHHAESRNIMSCRLALHLLSVNCCCGPCVPLGRGDCVPRRRYRTRSRVARVGYTIIIAVEEERWISYTITRNTPTHRSTVVVVPVRQKL